MGRVKLERTFDDELIRETHKLLWGEIAEEGLEEFNPDPYAHCYFACYIPEFIGLWVLEPVNAVTLDIHAEILKPYRRYAAESLAELYRWFLMQERYHKITASIPTFRKHVYRFAKQNGFRDEGVNRQSYLKDQFYDQWLLGITRQEVRGFLCR